MNRSPLPSRTGPCATFRIARGSKFCTVCGHTAGAHKYGPAPLPTPFEVVAELVYDSTTDEISY